MHILGIFTNNTVIFISYYQFCLQHIDFELDFDLVCCHNNECYQYQKVYACYEYNLCLGLFTFLRFTRQITVFSI